ncbi:MAG: sugar ABC transporter permease [Deltaproteobacteria bacterium]|nr:sugar ABC transporter permease [Deltaproteobacteria bacterium]
MDAETLQARLPGDRLAVAVPLRDAKDRNALVGVAGALMGPTPPSGALPAWWIPVVVGVLAALAAMGRNRWRRALDGAVAVGAGAIWWAWQPALPAAPSSGVAVLGGAMLVPHTAPPAAEPLTVAHVAVAALATALLAGWVATPLARVFDGARKDLVPYLYIGPAMAATTLLIFVPFAVGVGLSFVDRSGNFVGADHYAEVLRSITDANSSTHFGRTLAMTVLWTVVNVTLHVTLGLGLALVLNRPHLRGRALYRLLLIVPWAVPSYITALTWKWLFNTQAGPLNAMLVALGLDRVDWLGTSPWTNFAANLATNVWLGFPFMMVISLGALQSIPAELYEAADMDGGSGWQKFRHITLPLLRPALFPAVILGTIWTFNAFNVIWLVSGGGPDHQTDILITEAYYTFTVLRRTGLAAAYSVLIFLLLLGYTLVTNRLTRATQAVGA